MVEIRTLKRKWKFWFFPAFIYEYDVPFFVPIADISKKTSVEVATASAKRINEGTKANHKSHNMEMRLSTQ